ncbi:MAG: zinc ribbon domain-containing protein [Nitrosotalea sp.]
MISCPRCDLHIDRDVNAARNILTRGCSSSPTQCKVK